MINCGRVQLSGSRPVALSQQACLEAVEIKKKKKSMGCFARVCVSNRLLLYIYLKIFFLERSK